MIGRRCEQNQAEKGKGFFIVVRVYPGDIAGRRKTLEVIRDQVNVSSEIDPQLEDRTSRLEFCYLPNKDRIFAKGRSCPAHDAVSNF